MEKNKKREEIVKRYQKMTVFELEEELTNLKNSLTYWNNFTDNKELTQKIIDKIDCKIVLLEVILSRKDIGMKILDGKHEYLKWKK